MCNKNALITSGPLPLLFSPVLGDIDVQQYAKCLKGQSGNLTPSQTSFHDARVEIPLSIVENSGNLLGGISP